MSSEVKIIKNKNFSWFNVINNSEKEIKYLEKEFSFYPSDLEDCLPPLQRPKIIARPDYIFMILLFPVFDRKTRTIHASEVDFFITPKNIVTVHTNELGPIGNIFGELNNKNLKCSNPLSLVHEILNRLLSECFPMLVHTSNDIDNVEDRIKAEFEKGTITEILRIKTNIVNFRRAMQPHKQVIRSFLTEAAILFPNNQLKKYLDDLVNYTKEIWDLLDNYKDTIDALHETNVSLIDFRINEIMKTLTIFSVIVFPLTLLAAIFGMNVIKMPFVSHPYGFFIILGLMATGASGMLLFFKGKKWF
jgi:magnesium transporter